MKFTIHRSSKPLSKDPPVMNKVLVWDGDGWTIEIKYIDDLTSIIEQTGHELIVGRNTITIYDNFVE